MKIICTNEEKQALLNSFESNTELYCCLARPFIGCTENYESCRECLEKNIEWEIKEKQMQEPCEDVPDTNVGNIYECPCGYGWDKTKVVRHHFCPNCGAKVVEPTLAESEG